MESDCRCNKEASIAFMEKFESLGGRKKIEELNEHHVEKVRRMASVFNFQTQKISSDHYYFIV